MQDLPDFNNKNYTELNIKEFKKKHYKSAGLNFSGVFLILSVSAFLLSISYWVQKTQLETSSRAFSDNSMMMSVHDTMQPETLPKSYNGEVIPKTMVDELKKTAGDMQIKFPETYAKQQIFKYYIYRDALTENGVDIPTSDTVDANVKAMEDLVKEKLLSHADFAYVQARYKFASDEADLDQRYGSLPDKAKELMDTYTALFNDSSYTPQQVVDAANQDEQLLALNSSDKSEYLKDYVGNQSVLISDPSFQDYLFTLNPKEVSPVYTLKTTDGTEYGYAIVYPTKIDVQKYNSIEQIMKEKAGNFKY